MKNKTTKLSLLSLLFLAITPNYSNATDCGLGQTPMQCVCPEDDSDCQVNMNAVNACILEGEGTQLAGPYSTLTETIQVECVEAQGGNSSGSGGG